MAPTPAPGWSIGDDSLPLVPMMPREFSHSAATGRARSRSTATVKTSTNTAPTGAPTITGTATVGETLTAVTTAIMDGDGLTTPGYTYQWIRVATGGTETNISTATASTYTLVGPTTWARRSR